MGGLKVIGILTGDPELENFISKIGKRQYLKNWTVRLNDAVVYFLQNKNQPKFQFVKVTYDMIHDKLFKEIDYLFYNFLDPVAAKIISEELYKNILKLINKNPTKVFPPPKFANLIADKCTYYSFLQKANIPVVPFFCIDKKTFETNVSNSNNALMLESYVKRLYDRIEAIGWKGFIGKPVLGTSSRGFKLYSNFGTISHFEIKKQMATHLKQVFYEYKFPKIMFQEKHSEFGEGLRPELKMYYVGTKFMFGWVTYGKTYFEIGKAPQNSKFYMSVENVFEAKKFAAKVLRVIKPLFKGSPMLVTRVDIGCCLDHTNDKYNKKNFFLNEIEFAPAYVLGALPGKYKKYIDHQIGNQMLKILQYKFKYRS
jgi:hypothetical protein